MSMIKVAMHGSCLLPLNHCGVERIHNNIHEFNGLPLDDRLPVPTGERCAILVGSGISRITDDRRGCMGLVAVVAQYDVDDDGEPVLNIILKKQDNYAQYILGVDGVIPDSIVEAIDIRKLHKELVALQVRCTSLPCPDGDLVITNTMWCISTLCSKFKNISLVGHLHV